MLPENHALVSDLEPETILGNVGRLQELATQFGGGTEFPMELLARMIEEGTKVDTIVLLSGVCARALLFASPSLL